MAFVVDVSFFLLSKTIVFGKFYILFGSTEWWHTDQPADFSKRKYYMILYAILTFYFVQVLYINTNFPDTNNVFLKRFQLPPTRDRSWRFQRTQSTSIASAEGVGPQATLSGRRPRWARRSWGRCALGVQQPSFFCSHPTS